MMQSGDTYFGRGAGSVGTLNMTGGTLTGGNLHFGYDAGGGKGVANLSGTSVINLSGSLLVADGSTNVGTVTIGGSASVTTGGTLTIGNGNGTGSGASAATVVMNAGTLTTNGEIQVGNNGGTGSFTQNGGAVVANNWVTTGREYNDNNVGSTGVFTLNGGTFTRTAGSTGFFNITNGAGDVGTVNLNGGVLTVDKIVANGGTAATSTLNFNGGTLRASSSGTTDPGSGTNVAGDVTFLQGVTQVNVRNGGAVVDPNGFSITFNQVLSHSNVAGDNATDGGLTLNDSSSGGSGVLTLTAANTYNGGTFINAGVVVAQNSSAFGTGTVAQSDGTNSGNSRVSGVELQGGITLANNFVTSNNGAGTVPFAIDSNTGANTISGTITLRNGGGDTIIQSDSGSSLALSGNISIGSGYSGRNLVLQGASTGANTITGVVSNGGATLGVVKSGMGTWTLSNANTYTGNTTVNAGTLALGATNAAQATAGIAINSTGTLLVSANGALAAPAASTSTGNGVAGTTASTQVPLTLSGGTLLRNGNGVSLGTGLTVGVGALTLTTNSTLDFGTAGVGTLNFNGFTPNSSTLTIADYTRTTSTSVAGVDNVDDRLIFNQQLTSGQLADITFAGTAATEFVLGNGEFEVVPVPEPATILGGLLTLGMLGVNQRRRMANWLSLPRRA